LIVLFTNGTLLTPELVKLLQVWYPQYLEITLYGMTAQTYEGVTGVRGAFERCIQGIEALVEAQIPLRLKTVGMTLNKNEVSAMYDYAAKLNLQFRHDSALRPTFYGQDIRHLRLSPGEVVDLDYTRPDAEDMLRTAYDHALAAIKDNPLYDPERLYNCGAGFRSFHIDPYGLLTLCHMIRTPGYDLTVGTFAQGWEDFLDQMRSRTIKKDIDCLHCDLLGLCARCPAFSSLENDDPETVVDYACAIAHARAERLGVIVRS
jgi:radical SAM protein with 4Fe4S-binding SPASM domain